MTRISWEKCDIERKFCFPAGKYTSTGTVFTLLLGLIMTVVFYLILYPFANTGLGAMFYERGYIPYFISIFSFWSISILFVKWRKCALQKKSLDLLIVPQDPNFTLSPITADEIIKNVYSSVDDPRHFILLNRIIRAVSNLRNIGKVSDVVEMLKSQAENDENQLESSYSLVKGFIWAIPVLGFIGTVLGLSGAIGGFGEVLATGAKLEQLKFALQQVTAGLSIAFETTLIALICALIIQLILICIKSSEDKLLDECDNYCHREIISKLRILPLEGEE